MTDLCQGFDVILGNTFLGNRAVLNFEHHTVSLTRDGKLYQLKTATSAAEPDRNAELDEFRDDRQFLSCAQASRCMKNGCDSYLFVINTIQTETDAQPDTALSGYIDALRHMYADIFEPPAGLHQDRGIEHVIALVPDAQPAPQRMYRLAPTELTEVKAQVVDPLERSLIEPSTSAYGSPILLVKKKTGELKMVDYRALNKLTVKNRYSLPRVEALFDKLHGAKYFSSLDAASGFHQILLKPDDRPKTAFRTPFGHYQFKVLAIWTDKCICHLPNCYE